MGDEARVRTWARMVNVSSMCLDKSPWFVDSEMAHLFSLPHRRVWSNEERLVESRSGREDPRDQRSTMASP